MKLEIDHDIFLDAITTARSVVERRNIIPILGNLLIKAQDDQVQVQTTDMDIEIIASVPARVENPGITTVMAATLYDIIRKLPRETPILLHVDEPYGNLVIKAGQSNFSLKTLPQEDFPIMASTEYETDFIISGSVLHRLFNKTRFAMSTDESRYTLNGVYLHIFDNSGDRMLRCVATNGMQLGCLDAPLPPGIENMPSVIVPRKTVGELLKLPKDEETEITVSISENKIRFVAPDITLTSKVIDGKFPDYIRVIPQNNNRMMRVNANKMTHAVDRVSTVARDNSRGLDMKLETDRLVLSVSAPDIGIATEELAVAHEEGPMNICFNARFMGELMSQVDQEDAIFMFDTPHEPVLIHDGDDQNALYVIMPMHG